MQNWFIVLWSNFKSWLRLPCVNIDYTLWIQLDTQIYNAKINDFTCWRYILGFVLWGGEVLRYKDHKQHASLRIFYSLPRALWKLRGPSFQALLYTQTSPAQYWPAHSRGRVAVWPGWTRLNVGGYCEDENVLTPHLSRRRGSRGPTWCWRWSELTDAGSIFRPAPGPWPLNM